MQSISNLNINKVYAFGIVNNKPKYSHSTFGNDFYIFDLAVKRLSGCFDILPITLPHHLLYKIEENKNIGVIGQLRSYNIINKDANKLMLTVFVKNVLHEDKSNGSANDIYLEGYLCKPPIFRITPFKREICDLLLAVNRSYGKSDYIPMIAWGKNANMAQNFKTGEKIKITGRIQSRNYKKVINNEQEITKTAYEVSISSIEKLQ